MRVVSATFVSAMLGAFSGAAGSPGVAGASTGDPTSVIGGSNASAGKWPDVAAILYPSSGGSEEARCTGTLVAPSVVLTAGHCFDPNGLPDSVLIGATSLARPEDGETIDIARGEAFPDALNSEDVAVLVLAHPSRLAPRKIATGWARFDIVDGAAISLVGFGAVDKQGDRFVNDLQEAHTTITDFDCSRSSGCNAAAQPAGELGAGGKGIDTCPGDSGGPLYLMTPYGALLAGITSRSYDNAMFACSEGGIYGRPDKIIDWLETTAGVTVSHGPEPDADPIVAIRGDGGNTQIHVNDPANTSHAFEITTAPAHGTAKVLGNGAVRVCTDADAPPGEDSLTITIIDAGRAARSVPVTIKVQIEDGVPGPPCDLDDIDAGGCCDSRGGSTGAIPLTLCVLVVLRRRTRQRCATLRSWPRPG